MIQTNHDKDGRVRIVLFWQQRGCRLREQTGEMMKCLHRPEGSRALGVHRGESQAASDMCALLLDRQSIDVGDTFLRTSECIKHLVRFHRSGISNDVGIDCECRHRNDLHNRGLIEAVLAQRFVIFFRQTLWIT